MAIIDSPDTAEDQEDSEEKITPQQALVSWVMGWVEPWRTERDTAYMKKWTQYVSLARGEYTEEMRTRASERSSLVAPATMMAVDLSVSEIVEGVFGRERWFDVPDDMADQQKEDAHQMRDQLLEDLGPDAKHEFRKAFWFATVIGTGAVKIATDVDEVSSPVVEDGVAKKNTKEKVTIKPVCVDPRYVVVDPSTTDTDKMLGLAHEFMMPLWKIGERQKNGTYENVPVARMVHKDGMGTVDDSYSTDEASTVHNRPAAWITEWHGKVPANLLAQTKVKDEDAVGAAISSEDMGDMVEAVVTIANGSTLLRAIPNPSVMDDRAILAFQYDENPDSFWGRGVPAKAFHPQKAMDAEMRARVDSLAWINNPMLAGDVTKLPPRMNLDVWPGKFWGTKGNPREALQEFRFGDIGASTFQHTQELERQVQQATGALDSVMSLRGNIRDETATGSAISASGFIKRSKRTMFNIEGFLDKTIQRILWRKIQFEPDKYPKDYKFQVKGTIGIMARELEMQHLSSLLDRAPDGPIKMVLMKEIFALSSSANSSRISDMLDQMMKPDPQQQALQQAQMQQVIEQLRNLRADTATKLSNAGLSDAKTELTRIEAELKHDAQLLDNLRVMQDFREVQNAERQTEISAEKLDVERERVKLQARALNDRSSTK